MSKPESIRETLRRRPGGIVDGSEVTWAKVGQYLMQRYLNNEEEKARKEKAAQRQRLYASCGDGDMLDMLQKVFRNDEVIELRKRWIEFGKYNNVLRRLCNELATVYSLPAVRKVGGDQANQANYKSAQRLCRLDEVMQQVNPMLLAHRALEVGPRMRRRPDATMEPVIDVVTPASFSAVRDPLDPSLQLAVAFENDYALPEMAPKAPRWTVWTWAESFMMNSLGEVIVDTVREHSFGRIPWILLTLDAPSGKLFDNDGGDDLVAAAKAIWFLNILHLKELKSATKQTLTIGDASAATRRQVNDTDATGSLPEGVAVETIDRSMDVSIFPAGAQHIAEVTGSNYGIAPGVLRGDSVASADARELQRIPLRELRLRQHVVFREFERQLAELLSMVVGASRGDLRFTTEEWSITFSDPQTPLGSKESLDVFQLERQLTLTSTKREVMRRNPDLDEAQAEEFIEENIQDELTRNVEMKQLQQISGSASAIPFGVAAAQPQVPVQIDRQALPLVMEP